MENCEIVDQRRVRVDQFIEAHCSDLANNGSVVKSWRGPQRLGPYFKLTCRDQEGRQHAVYLGADSKLAHEVQEQLLAIQADGRARRRLAKTETALHRQLAAQREEVDEQLRGTGLWRKGAELRGWRQLGKRSA